MSNVIFYLSLIGATVVLLCILGLALEFSRYYIDARRSIGNKLIFLEKHFPVIYCNFDKIRNMSNSVFYLVYRENLSYSLISCVAYCYKETGEYNLIEFDENTYAPESTETSRYPFVNDWLYGRYTRDFGPNYNKELMDCSDTLFVFCAFDIQSVEGKHRTERVVLCFYKNKIHFISKIDTLKSD